MAAVDPLETFPTFRLADIAFPKLREYISDRICLERKRK